MKKKNLYLIKTREDQIQEEIWAKSDDDNGKNNHSLSKRITNQ